MGACKLWILASLPVLTTGLVLGAEEPSQARAAALAAHVAELRPRVPAGFTLVLQPPFVVVGDEDPAIVRQRAEGTVQWAVDRLQAQFFAQDPPEILDIWLFRDQASYEKHVRQLFGQEPTTPFGYYSAKDHALVMNIATGGGTLVHEIVHPLMAANFPGCPAWFNEGLGSLYEQSTEVRGKIRGLTNWRLEGLQESIRRKRLPSFRALCAMGPSQFYDDQRGMHYAQARYLCYYLQEHELLEKFYRQFHARRAEDPSGYATLQAVLGRDDLEAFQRQWDAWVLKLHFP